MKKKNLLAALTFLLIMLTTNLLSPCAPRVQAECMGYDIKAYWDNDVKAWVDKHNLQPDPWSQTITVNYEINIVFVGNYKYDWYIKVAPNLIKNLNSERVGNKITGSWTIKLSDLVDPKNNKNIPNGDYEFSIFGPGGCEYTYFNNVYSNTVKPDHHYYTPDARFIVADVESTLSCPNQAAPGESVTVSWDKAPQNGDAWIGFFKSGDPDSNPIRRVFINSLNGNQWTLPSSFTGVSPGVYDFRLYKNNTSNYYMNGKTNIQFRYKEPMIQVHATEVHPGDNIRITWTGGPPHDPDGHMDIYHADTLWGAFTAGLDPEGDVQYHLHTNAPPGFYQVRMYAGDDILVGVSNGFAVTPAGSQQPQGGGAGGGGTTAAESSGSIVLTVGQDQMLVNGSVDASFHDTPVIVENRVFVPIGAVIKAMGGSTSWAADEQKVSISLNGRVLNLWIGQNRALINGQEASLDVSPYISSTGRTMLPLGFISQNLGSQINWDGANQRVTINYGTALETGNSNTNPPAAGSENNTTGLMAEYKFNGDCKDGTGNGNDGAVVGDVSFVDDSVMGKCAVFNGGYIDVKSSTGLNLGSQFTVSLWIQVDPSMADPTNKSGPIISKLNDAGGYNNYIWYTKGTYGMRADLKTNRGDKLIQNKPFTDYKLNSGWSQLVFSGDGQNLYLYHNGSLIATQAIGSDVSINPSTGNMRIGNGSDVNQKNLLFKGKMDDLRIYNRTLSAVEIQSLYNGGTPTGN
ncbi:MAG: stalk domain-containing protein [Syntrophomonadaceae bacterium]